MAEKGAKAEAKKTAEKVAVIAAERTWGGGGKTRKTPKAAVGLERLRWRIKGGA